MPGDEARAQIMNVPDSVLKHLLDINDEPDNPWIPMIREELSRRRGLGVIVNDEGQYIPDSSRDLTQEWRMKCPLCKAVLINMSHMMGCPLASDVDIRDEDDPDDTPVEGLPAIVGGV